eukprot:1172982-Alexandrium_andersonii.AAC.1
MVDQAEEDYLQDHAGKLPDDELQTLSRKDRKAMDREIPWRDILKRSLADVAKFIDALNSKVEQWKKFDTVEEIPDVEADRILRDPALRRRCMPSR